MATKHSKNTMALLASYPSFQEWVVKNLTLTQIDTICKSPRFEVCLTAMHPLGDEKFAAGVFRAYRSEVVWLIKSQYESLEDFDMMRGGQETFDALYHHALITAIAFMTDESPEVLQQAVDDREVASGS